MKLLIVIVNYNGFDLTVDCLESVAKQIHDVPGTHVGLCENGSGADSAERLHKLIVERRWSDWLELTAIAPNRGFTGGNNVVINAALRGPDPPEYVLLLNNDTIVRPNALQSLVEFMDQHADVGIAGSRLEDPDGTVQISAFRFMNVFSEFDRGLRLGLVTRLLRRYITTPPIPTDASPTDWVAGASLIVRRPVLQQIGALDEGYYTYFDDIDYCRMARNAGWPTWYVPHSRIVHLVGKTTGVTNKAASARVLRRPNYWFAARRRYLLKHHNPLYAALAEAAYLVGFTLWRLRRRIQRLPDNDPEHFLVDSLRNSVFIQGFRMPVVENPAFASRP